MRLIVIGSNSSGNAYALDAGGEILLLEAGVKYREMAKAIDFRIDKVVGCCITHEHGDHAKFVKEYSKHGIKIYCNEDVATKKDLSAHYANVMVADKVYHAGEFNIVPFDNYHDVPIFGYLINHKECGSILFSTDSYKLGMTIRGIKHFIIEANYSDELLKQNVWDGNILKAQADRIMLSHMSLDYCVKYLKDAEAAKSAKTITLCHLSSRNSDYNIFRNTVAGMFGVPTYIAQKGEVIEL